MTSSKDRCAGALAVVALVETYAQRRAERQELSAEQLAALDSVALSHRGGEITAADVEEIEPVIRAGHVAGARKRLTRARRRRRRE